METNKISAIATVIAIISCKMKQEGFYELNSDGLEYKINPKFIIEVLHMCEFKEITLEDIYNTSNYSFAHDLTYRTHEATGEYITLEKIICSEHIIDKINSIDIQPQNHLILSEPLYKKIHPPL